MQLITANRIPWDRLLGLLASSQAHLFDCDLESKLPEKHGVYAISVGDGEDTKFVWVGITDRSKRGLRRRVWEDHYKNPTNTSDLPNVLVKVGAATNTKDAKRWITRACKVRWIEVEDERMRMLLEHYATALLQPDPTAGSK